MVQFRPSYSLTLVFFSAPINKLTFISQWLIALKYPFQGNGALKKEGRFCRCGVGWQNRRE